MGVVDRADKMIRKIDWDLATDKYQEAFGVVDQGVGRQTSANGGFGRAIQDFFGDHRPIPYNHTVAVDGYVFDYTTSEETVIPQLVTQEDINFAMGRLGLAPDVVIFDDPDLNIAEQLEI